MYEIVIEDCKSRRGGWGRRFGDRPVVIACVPEREIAITIAEALAAAEESGGNNVYPFDWDTISVWEVRTNQKAYHHRLMA